MFHFLAGSVLLIGGIHALVCPKNNLHSPVAGIIEFKDGGDGSCYSDIDNGRVRNYAYPACASYNSYLPFVLNAFQNAVLQQKTAQGTWNNRSLPGMWLGLTCLGNTITTCSWDDGTPLTNSSYSNFAKGFPSATMGPCVYQDGTTGLWKSETCSLRKDIGYFCKFTPTNNVPMCVNQDPFDNDAPYPYYLNGYCYSFRSLVEDMDHAEALCKNSCSFVTSIHSEGENSFVRDMALTDRFRDTTDGWDTAVFLGLKADDSQWLDGSSIDYTHYSNRSTTPGLCTFLALNESRFPMNYWYTHQCKHQHLYYLQYVVCKKPIVNECDSPYPHYPTDTPATCSGPQYLNISGTVQSPGHPYYPYGIQPDGSPLVSKLLGFKPGRPQPDTCEYIQKVPEDLHPSMFALLTADINFRTNISKFEFYSSEDPNDQPFYVFNGPGPLTTPTVTSPTNIMRAVYTTTGDAHHTNDWSKLFYNAEQKLSCSFVMDYGYLGPYTVSASNIYLLENQLISKITTILAKTYDTTKCDLDFYWNSAAYGNVDNSYSQLTPANYTDTTAPNIPSTGTNSVDLCSFIDKLNAYEFPLEKENPCLVLFSGRSAEYFSTCRPLNVQKFKYTFGVAIDGATGVSTFTSNIVNMDSSFTDYNSLANMIVNTIRPSVCVP